MIRVFSFRDCPQTFYESLDYRGMCARVYLGRTTADFCLPADGRLEVRVTPPNSRTHIFSIPRPEADRAGGSGNLAETIFRKFEELGRSISYNDMRRILGVYSPRIS